MIIIKHVCLKQFQGIHEVGKAESNNIIDSMCFTFCLLSTKTDKHFLQHYNSIYECHLGKHFEECKVVSRVKC